MQRGLFGQLVCAVTVALSATVTARAQMSHDHMSHVQMSPDHGGAKSACNAPTLACASKVTPAFAADGTLWLAWMAAGTVSVAHSQDAGRTFSPAVAVNPTPLDLDWGPDARPKIAIDRDGRIYIAFAIFKDKAYNGEVFYTRSTDGGRSFEPPRPITTNPESQRFEAIALDPNGALFAAWLDKRNRAPAKERNEKYIGAGLAFTWSNDHGDGVAESTLAVDNTCECCRLGIGFVGPGRPVVAFRNVFGGTVRDHAIITFADPHTPGPIQRISVDDWKTDVCPHQGPSLAVASGGTHHVTWFTNGNVRKGVFYANSRDGGRTFSDPMTIGQAGRGPSRPFLLEVQGALWLTWKEFDGEDTTVATMVSHDDGRTWSPPKTVAQTTDTSDHPLLTTDGKTAYLSWQTKIEGYRLIALRDAP